MPTAKRNHRADSGPIWCYLAMIYFQWGCSQLWLHEKKVMLSERTKNFSRVLKIVTFPFQKWFFEGFIFLLQSNIDYPLEGFTSLFHVVYFYLLVRENNKLSFDWPFEGQELLLSHSVMIGLKKWNLLLLWLWWWQNGYHGYFMT